MKHAYGDFLCVIILVFVPYLAAAGDVTWSVGRWSLFALCAAAIVVMRLRARRRQRSPRPAVEKLYGTRINISNFYANQTINPGKVDTGDLVSSDLYQPKHGVTGVISGTLALPSCIGQFPPRFSRYVCGECERSIVTIQRVPGKAPSQFSCLDNDNGCGGEMTLSICDIECLIAVPDYELYLPRVRPAEDLSPMDAQIQSMCLLRLRPMRV